MQLAFTIAAAEETEEEPERIDLSSPEDVLIEVIMHDPAGSKTDWENFGIESTTVINGKEGITGAAEYERCYGTSLDYTIKDLIDPPGEGWFVVQGVTAKFHRGDGWTTDDDMSFWHEAVRPATPEEIAEA
ncbi:hypothetical protein B7L88_gp122 [Rhizobium phage RHEph10]|uniref:hypothetical protein n=1 Tax=Rhizobium phage RHEph10 TaxID=1220717 RepID=UPI0002AB1046|nr:hypothetical protein B7L88_gp122 [Rhizobium phage RHEph10]AGC36166.1 hypothetical protein RHEph10_gp123 [Rhizobium phage RHEph10]